MNRYAGGLWGLLIGDALGVPYEFNPPDNLPPMEQLEMTPPHGFRKTYSGSKRINGFFCTIPAPSKGQNRQNSLFP